MTVLWWLVSLALVALSALLMAAGVQGKEGVLRIGQPPDARGPDASGRPAGTESEPASGQPERANAWEARGLPDASPAEEEPESGPPPGRMNLANVAIGAAGIAVGLAAIVIFAI